MHCGQISCLSEFQISQNFKMIELIQLTQDKYSYLTCPSLWHKECRILCHRLNYQTQSSISENKQNLNKWMVIFSIHFLQWQVMSYILQFWHIWTQNTSCWHYSLSSESDGCFLYPYIKQIPLFCLKRK